MVTALKIVVAYLPLALSWAWIPVKKKVAHDNALHPLTLSFRGWKGAERAAEGGAEAGVAGLAAPGDAGSLQNAAPQHLTTSYSQQQCCEINEKR